MKILFLLGHYLPTKTGGIENYCNTLAKIVIEAGHKVDVAILDELVLEPYSYKGIRVLPLPKGNESFKELLIMNAYDTCHIHEYSAFGGIELFWFKDAKRYCKQVFFTFHLPYFTCYKNDFRYYGIVDCNIFSEPDRCKKCIIATKLHYSKNNKLKNGLINKLLLPIVERTERVRKLKQDLQSRQDDLKELIRICDKIFVISNWFRQLLIENGYVSKNIVRLPSLVKREKGVCEKDSVEIKNKIIFIGRIEPEKGLLLLCQALRDNQNLTLDVYGNITDKKYLELCKKEFAFNYKQTLPNKELREKLVEYDFLIAPGLAPEMSPLAVHEALNSHLPVIASNSKGNADLIQHTKNGLLFEYGASNELRKAISEGYRLKEEGWEPLFTQAKDDKNDIDHIVSYYYLRP